MKECELCGTTASGAKNERIEEYQDRLYKSALVSRDERALVFMAEDQLSKLDSISSSSRELPHEPDWGGASLRYAYPEESAARIKKAIKFLQSALDSLEEHNEESKK